MVVHAIGKSISPNVSTLCCNPVVVDALSSSIDMDRRWKPQRLLYLILSSLGLFWPVGSSAGVSSVGGYQQAHAGVTGNVQTTTISLDLSSVSHLPETDLIETICAHVHQESLSSFGDGARIIDLDVSGSSLREDGMIRILEEIRKTSLPCSLHLVARMSQLTPRGAGVLLEHIVDQVNSTAALTLDVAEQWQGNSSSGPLTPSHPFALKSLDLSWNSLNQQAEGSRHFFKALEKLFGAPLCCPADVRLDRCGLGPAACRAIAKGLMQRASCSITRDGEDENDETAHTNVPETNRDVEPGALSLSLSGNPNIGDAGLAALAAAIRISSQLPQKKVTPIFDKLDVSACGIGDAGIDALALVFEGSPGLCIEALDLSNNAISDNGAKDIADAVSRASSPCLGQLNLSGNGAIGDNGLVALAEVIASGKLKNLSIRSCMVQAEGASALGKAIRRGIESGSIDIDLSGNPLGLLRGKIKSDGGKYSASRLKSKATATAASYMSQGMGLLKKGLKEVGMDNVLGATTGESDDEEEETMGAVASSLSGPSKAPCGIKALVNAFLDEKTSSSKLEGKELSIRLGLRHSCLDHGAADALAAMLIAAEDMGVDLELDVGLNSVLEEDMTAALSGRREYREHLSEMSDRHMDALESIRVAKERASAAGDAVRRRQHQEDLDWDLPMGLEGQDCVSEYEWDSDADYDEVEL